MPGQTGPKTPEGKARSAKNAIKHGLTSERMFVLDNETPAEWDLMLQHWTEKLKPWDAAELLIVEDIAHAQWKIRRARTVETGIIDMQMDDQADYMAETYLPPVDEGCRTAYAFKTLADDSNALSQIHRYESRARRAFKNGLAALKELRAMTATETATTHAPAPAPAGGKPATVSEPVRARKPEPCKPQKLRPAAPHKKRQNEMPRPRRRHPSGTRRRILITLGRRSARR